MKKITRIVMFEGEIETVGFFSLQMKRTFEELGYKVFMMDLQNAYRSSMNLVHFLKKDETAMLSFNFHGISGEPYLLDASNRYIWDAFHVSCYNILVDHPMYYERFLAHLPEQYVQFCIDRNHERYMRRFYPQVRLGDFLPLAGTNYRNAVVDENSKGMNPATWECRHITRNANPGGVISRYRDVTDVSQTPPERPYLTMGERPLGLILTGNCLPYDNMVQHLKLDGPEYERFYRGIAEELLSCPEKTMEEVAEAHYKALAEEPVAEEEVGVLIRRLTFIDLLVRYYMRGEVVKALVDHGVRLHTYGSGYTYLDIKHPENLMMHGQMNSIDCLKVHGEARVSLNVMPWFKDGAHDRIFNSMLNGSVSLTDTSVYLKEILQNGEDAVFYSLTNLAELPELTKELLSNNERLQSIADKAYANAAKEHTWEQRARQIAGYME